MKNDKIVREAVRAILFEAYDDAFDDDNSIYAKHVTDGAPRNQRPSDEFDFPVWDAEDREYVVSAVYSRMSPFKMELWKAVDTSTGEEIDVDELETIVPDLQDRAFDFITRRYD